MEADQVIAPVDQPIVGEAEMVQSTAAVATAAADPVVSDQVVAEGVVETTELPKQPKLKKKSELENSLLESIEEFGE